MYNKEIAQKNKKVCMQGHPYTVENVYINARGYRSCRICRRNKNAIWLKKHPEYHKAQVVRWRLNNPEKVKLNAYKTSLKNKYGITLDQYQKMSEKQKNVCFICGKNDKKTKLSVDHDHKTGKIRKLLCSHCNHILGLSYENIKILESAISYLNNHKNI